MNHPTEPMPYDEAIAYVEDFLTRTALDDDARSRGFKFRVYDYLDGNADGLAARPWLGVRVAEVGFSNGSGGGSYMQTDAPWGVAFCGQIERCIIALVECWNDEEPGETDDEFWRLEHLVQLANEAPVGSEILALYFTPGAIRDHFDGQDDPVAEAVMAATDDKLREVGEDCINADTLYSEFHRLLVEVSREVLDIDDQHYVEPIIETED